MKDLIISRVFDAPRKHVWKAWAKPERLTHWWGPKDYTTPVCEMDFRIEGRYLICMRSPEGKDFWRTGIYVDIIHLEKIVYTDSFADEKGNEVSAAYYGLGTDFPSEMEVTVTFAEKAGRTAVTIQHMGIPAEMRESTKRGWNESFDKLEESFSLSPAA